MRSSVDTHDEAVPAGWAEEPYAACAVPGDAGCDSANHVVVDYADTASAGAGAGVGTGTSDTRLGAWLARLPYFPLFFLGLGVYRAWIELVFVGSYIRFPIDQVATQNVFDAVMVIVMLLVALLSKRLHSLMDRTLVYWISGTTLTLSTGLIFCSWWLPDLAAVVVWPGAVLGGFGIALLILMWSEVYSCLNPLRVVLYYSGSLITAALIIYLCRVMYLPGVNVLTLLMPVVSLLCVLASYRSISTSDLPTAAPHSFSFPWKPVLLMAVYGFAFGLRELSLYASTFGPHSSFGTVAVAVFVFVGVLIQGERFDFAWIYRLALPLMVGAFLLLPSFGFVNEFISGLCASASYGAFSILIMLILANVSYRYGVSALWLFGFERGIRLLFVFFGRQVEDLVGHSGLFGESSVLIINVLIVIMVVAVSLILYSEKELSSRWGVSFLSHGDTQADDAILRKQVLADRCHELAKQHQLSQREEEVLLLLAQKKTISTIERELFIANGTAKAHVRHIYRKLDIHTREDLFSKVSE